MIDTTSIKENLKLIASELSIQKYDIYGSSGRSTSVSVDSGVADKVTAKETSSCVLRVWDAQNSGSISTSNLTQAGLKTALSKALEVAKLGLQDLSPDFSSHAHSPINEKTKTIQTERAQPKQLIDKLLKMEAEVLESDEAIQRLPYNGISDSVSKEFYINSEGAFRECEHAVSSCYLYALAQQEDKRSRKAYAYRLSNDVSTLDVGACVEETIEKTKFSLDYIPLGDTQDFTVVFSPEAFLSLFGAFSNLWSARDVLDKKSLSNKNSLGEVIAVPYFNFKDDPLHPKNLAKSLFDQEGTPTKQHSIIQSGVLTQFIHNEETAKDFGVEPSGHAVIGARPTVSSHYFHISNSDQNVPPKKPEDTPKIVYVEQVTALHAGVQAMQGSFSLPVDGWVSTDAGKKSFETAVVSGDIKSLLKNIVYMDPEPVVTDRGVCPHIWVKGLKITG